MVRRRRQCNVCEKRFTTYERVEETAGLVVIKRDGSRVPFDRERIMRGVQLACGKRAVPEAAKVALVDAVDEEVHRDFDREVPSSVIGEKVMQRLKDRNVGTGIHFRAVHEQAWYRKNLPVPPGALPATEWNSSRILSLPLFPAMIDGDVDRVVEAVEDSLEEPVR